MRPEGFEPPASRLRRPVFYPVELETHVEFVSNGASLIRHHFTGIFFEAADRIEVRSTSSYLFATRIIIPNSHRFRRCALSASTLTKLGRGARDRTLDDRVKVCCVANYTTPQ